MTAPTPARPGLTPDSVPSASPELSAPAAPVLELRGVRAGYGTIDVLHGVDLSLHAGQVLALLGANGAGKSTTLKVATGQIVPTAGTVALCGRPVNGLSFDALARAGVCLIPEGRGVFPNLTVLDNLRMATFTGSSLRDVCDRAFVHFPRLAERRRQVAGTLSGGEQQMLALARALATEPAVLLLDELSMGLAPLVVAELYGHVQRIAASGIPILVVEQFAYEVLEFADAAAVMQGGRVQATGRAVDIADQLRELYLGASP